MTCLSTVFAIRWDSTGNCYEQYGDIAYFRILVQEYLCRLRSRSNWQNGDTVYINADMHQMALTIIAKTFFA